MHILISAVSSARQPSGICRHAANLASCLANAPGISQVTLLVGAWQEAYFDGAFGLRHSRVRVVPINISRNPVARNAWYYWSLADVAWKNRADIVHLAFPAPVRQQRFRCPIVCSLHDLYPYDAPRNFGQFKVRFNRTFLRQCLNASDAVVCSSDFTLRRLQQYAPEAASRKAARIYQMVMLDPEVQSRSAGVDLVERPFLLTVAQHRRNKNLHLLLAAFAALRDRATSNRQLKLVMAGAEGPETRKLLSTVRKLSLDQQVVFAPALSDAELCWLYSNCDLMVVPSSVEGFCFPVVEAIRCGGRVLCSDIPVLREVGGTDCHFFDLTLRERGLASAIEKALEAPMAERQSLTRFSAQKILHQYWALYSALLSSRRTASQREIPRLDSDAYDQYAS